MKADRLSGAIAPLNFKLGTRQMWATRLNPQAPLLSEKKPWFTLSWRLGGCWSWSGCFGEDNSSLASAKIWTQELPIQCTHYVAAKIWTPDIPGYILVNVLIMIPQTDFKIIRKSVLTEWEGRFGLDVFVSWQEFLEELSELDNFPWSFVKGDFLWWIMCNVTSLWKWGNWY